MKRLLFFIVSIIILLPKIDAQVLENYLGDESTLYAQTKQVNQFFRRFNGEENFQGERYYPEDKEYRDPKLRKSYLENLFNKENPYITPDLQDEFIKQILNVKNRFTLIFMVAIGLLRSQPNFFSTVLKIT